MSFDKIFDLPAGVYFNFYNISGTFYLCCFISLFWKQSAVPTSVFVRIRRDHALHFSQVPSTAVQNVVSQYYFVYFV